ncbi:IS4 family transposase [Deltaproteobacteria bacterium]|nr:IS4 family transposase [Deltaproteobacteria bacterium]
MAFTTKHYVKKTGATYVYSVESYWDKEKKQPRNKQVCLGRLDEKTGEIIPSGRKKRVAKRAAAATAEGITATTKVIGPHLIIDKVASDTGLADTVRKSFGAEAGDLALSLAYFEAQRGLPLSRSETWSESHEHPFGERIASQRVSDFLTALGDDRQSRFFSLWLDKLSENECFCYDITSISSYSESNAYVRWGHNRDGEKLPQINLAVLYGQTSGLPAYMRSLPGSISDVSTLKTTIKALDFIGQTKLTFVLDRGFYSENNVNELFKSRYHFVVAPITSRVWVRKILDSHYEEIKHPLNHRKLPQGETLFMKTHLHNWNGRRCYLHIYYNARRAASDYDGFTASLLDMREELLSGKIDEAKEDLYKRFFIVKDLPKRGRQVDYNVDAIEKYRNRYAGFFCLLTTEKMAPEEALTIYRNKDAVENCFDDLKNGLDMNRLRIHSSEAMRAKLLLQFLALVLISRIRTVIKSNPKLKNMAVREVLEAMETVVMVKYSGRYGHLVTEAGPLQRDILAAFDIALPA